MAPLAATIATAAALFAGTNLDDMVVLAVLHAASRAEGRPTAGQIWAGQYAGMTLLVGASVLAALGLTVLPASRVWLLGFVPLGLGAYKLVAAVRAMRAGAPAPHAAATGIAGIAALTVASGGDNVAAYTPFFRTADGGEIAVTLAVFAAGTAVWCAAGRWLVSHASVTRAIGRGGHWVVAVVFVAIGVYVFVQGEVPGRLSSARTREVDLVADRMLDCQHPRTLADQGLRPEAPYPIPHRLERSRL
jgi:cadmium resistance protein CadD (predicted permease)